MTSTYQPRRSKGVLLATEFRRFTPMHVGTVPSLRAVARTPAVHPHARGDDRSFSFCSRHLFGSPPRAWGRCSRHRWCFARMRFTPTRVGTIRNSHRCRSAPCRFTPTRVGTSPSASVILRSVRFTPTRVGTMLRSAASSRRCAGSPPRAWGRSRRGSAGEIAELRFTPTRVGTMRPSGTVSAARRFTPTRVGTTACAGIGTMSPHRFTPTRVGTTRPSRRGQLARQRFTPTRVGTTAAPLAEPAYAAGSPPRAWGRLPRCDRCCRRDPVHPHARGDDAATAAPVLGARDGSPPRAWGRPSASSTRRRAARAVHPHARGDDRLHWYCRWPAARFTPTRVGTTPVCTSVGASRYGSPPRAWGRPHVAATPRMRVTVHPHARGDDATPVPQLAISTGSPPRAWGRRLRRCPTMAQRYGSPPRAWGRQSDRSRLDGTAAGSPPRAWGRRCRSRPRSTATTVHPHARGDDSTGRREHDCRTVHPHARGDDCAVGAMYIGQLTGSPPRAWGRLAHRLLAQRAASRFTPTRVGTTDCASQAARSVPVHPHARGDDSVEDAPRHIARPVHPHARGDDRRSAPRGSRSPVHPHARGDDRDAAGTRASRAGSPPRAWGRPISLAYPRPRRSVHPHARGDDCRRLPDASSAAAVHPHARGDDRLPSVTRAVPSRFTPTRVGTTDADM